MTAGEAWYDWMEELREKVGSYKGIAGRLALHHNTVLNWLETGLPDVDQELPLAALAGEPVTRLRALIDAAREERLARRLAVERARLERRREGILAGPQPGTAGAVVPSPKRLPARRRRLLGLVWACASAWGLLGPLGAVEASPITVGGYVREFAADLRDSVAFRRRRALA